MTEFQNIDSIIVKHNAIFTYYLYGNNHSDNLTALACIKFYYGLVPKTKKIILTNGAIIYSTIKHPNNIQINIATKYLGKYDSLNAKTFLSGRMRILDNQLTITMLPPSQKFNSLKYFRYVINKILMDKTIDNINDIIDYTRYIERKSNITNDLYRTRLIRKHFLKIENDKIIVVTDVYRTFDRKLFIQTLPPIRTERIVGYTDQISNSLFPVNIDGIEKILMNGDGSKALIRNPKEFGYIVKYKSKNVWMSHIGNIGKYKKLESTFPTTCILLENGTFVVYKMFEPKHTDFNVADFDFTDSKVKITRTSGEVINIMI